MTLPSLMMPPLEDLVQLSSWEASLTLMHVLTLYGSFAGMRVRLTYEWLVAEV